MQPVFQYLFLQILNQTLQTLLGEQECSDNRALAALSDRLWVSHNPPPHEVMAVQEPAGGGEQQVAAVQPKKKQFKKKSGGGCGSSGSGASSGNGGVLSHAEQARVGSGLCFKHFCYGAAARGCTKPCYW